MPVRLGGRLLACALLFLLLAQPVWAQGREMDLTPLAETLAQDPRLQSKKRLIVEAQGADPLSRQLAGRLSDALERLGFEALPLARAGSGSGADLALVRLEHERRQGQLVARAQALDFMSGDLLAQGFAVLEAPADEPEPPAPESAAEQHWFRVDLGPDERLRAALLDALVLAQLSDQGRETYAVYRGVGATFTYLSDPFALSFTLTEATSDRQSNADQNLSQPFEGRCSVYDLAGEYHWHSREGLSGWNLSGGLALHRADCSNRLDQDGSTLDFTGRGLLLSVEGKYIWDTGLMLGFRLPVYFYGRGETESEVPTGYSFKASPAAGMVFGYSF